MCASKALLCIIKRYKEEIKPETLSRRQAAGGRRQAAGGRREALKTRRKAAVAVGRSVVSGGEAADRRRARDMKTGSRRVRESVKLRCSREK